MTQIHCYRRLPTTLALLAIALAPGALRSAESPLFARGHAVVPAPQQVELGQGEFQFDATWGLQLDNVQADDVAVETLNRLLDERYRMSLALDAPKSAKRAVVLAIEPAAVAVGDALDRDRDILAREAYRIDLAADRIRIVANAGPGLLYGVETLVQMVKLEGGRLLLPEGAIRDWPDLQLRLIFWDDAHHVETVEAFRRVIRLAALFKINAIGLKLEGHFQFASAPALVEPYAWSADELQELTDYALHHHVQLIPWLDAPAHVAFILKHPEYAHLRAFPDNNYEMCVMNPEGVELLVGMFRDLIEANQGVEYIYFSTDEAYYVGMADNPQCRETARARELGGNGRLLAEYIGEVSERLRAMGRKVVFMGEFPLEPSNIEFLPPYLINTIVNGPRFDPLYKARGIRQMLHTSTQGEEELFPSYFPLPNDRRLHKREREELPRVPAAFEGLSTHSGRRDADVLGTINAGWGDAGLHPETFWLGYAAITAAGWKPSSPDPREGMHAFYRAFYGAGGVELDRLYELMSYQAQVWSDSWEYNETTARKPIFGYSRKINVPRAPADDFTIDLPRPPAPYDLAHAYPWSWANRRRLEIVADARREFEELSELLDANLGRVHVNRYNLEVFESIARLYEQNLDFLEGLASIDQSFAAASKASLAGKPRDAVAAMDRALDEAHALKESRDEVVRHAERVWYKTWQPRALRANGRQFFHELDDVKDHEPDRTVDLSYLVYRQLLLPMDSWIAEALAARNSFALRHALPERR